MKESNMENEKTPLYVAFSTQKGGVGKTTFTVLAASYLYYLKGYDVAVVDCDYPQHSIAGMRKRDAEQSERMKITSAWRMNSLPGWGRKPTRYYAVHPKRRLQRLTNI